METTSSFMTYQNHKTNYESYSLQVEISNPKSVTRGYVEIFCKLGGFFNTSQKNNFLNINSMFIPAQDAIFS